MSTLRERVEALADQWEATRAAIPASPSQIDAGIRVTLRECAAELRTLTALRIVKEDDK